MRLQLQKHLFRLTALSLLLSLSAIVALAQTTSFTYQGRLSDGGAPATGTYDLQLTLWDALSGGTQQPQPSPVTVTRTSVLVSGGIFTVQLDFGASAFPGADRFLEIGVRLAGGGAFTILSPRQQITSTPYAIRSLNASSADAVTVSGVPGGSGNYIQNNPPSQQSAANFNITGNGTAGGTLSGNIVNAGTQFNLNGSRFLSSNLFNGTFVGLQAGNSGANNTFVGISSGTLNTNGAGNSYFGEITGKANTIGNGNSFFGYATGLNNTGSYNTFLGVSAGSDNKMGGNNTLIGAYTHFGSDALTNATAIGAQSQVDQSNALVLGSVAGVNGATSSVNVGIGTPTPQASLDVNGTALFRGGATVTGTNGDGAVLTARRPIGDPFVIIDATTVAQNSVLAFRKSNFNRWLMYTDNSTESGANAGSNFKLDAYNNAGGIANYLFVNRATGSVGIGTTTPFLNTKLDIVGGLLRLDQLAGGGDEPLCRNSAVHTIATCNASSLRYKESVQPLRQGLHLIQRLRPVTFNWKEGGRPDLGLIAEDVAKVEPLLVTHNDKGEIEGVKYDRLNIILINAVKQQQEQIETLRTANAALNAGLRSVERIVRKKVGSARRRR